MVSLPAPPHPDASSNILETDGVSTCTTSEIAELATPLISSVSAYTATDGQAGKVSRGRSDRPSRNRLYHR